MSGLVAAERRLVLRVEEYWDNLRRDRAFPRTADIDPVELGEDWCDCFVMNPCEPPEDAVFLFIGPRLLENARLPEDWARSAERRRSEEHTSELQSLMRTSYAVFCLKKKNRHRESKEHTVHTTT